ncbi:MAG TPA: serine protease [Thermoanaerobaculia bacterium]|nr:serine protease [Thermoanaerobaculia bacterium]
MKDGRGVLGARCCLLAGFALLAAVGAAQAQKGGGDDPPGPLVVGKIVEEAHVLPDITKPNWTETPLWTLALKSPSASYIAPHFSAFSLPEGAYLVIRSPRSGPAEGTTYTGAGKILPHEVTGGFWATHVPGDTALLELYSHVPVRGGSLVIDRYGAGFPRDESGFESLCGNDDTRWAKCYQTSEPAIYSHSRAVLRLLINGNSACTGWLVGNAGHVMTNNHCIGGSADAANTDYEIMAEGASCTTACNSWFGCPGVILANSATFVKTSVGLDYTLVQLPVNPTGTYGFLQMRTSGPTVDERVYIPQHPLAWGKRIAVTSDNANDQSGFCEIFSLNEPPCSGSGSDVGYFADTQGGSSGSPVIAYSDNLVVALHHCAACPNRGVPIGAVIADLGASLPPASTVNPCTNPCPTGGVYDGANCYMWSVPGNAPFIWQGGLYYQPLWHPNGPCPHPGPNNWSLVNYPATFDGANCYFGNFGPNPFIWGGNYYLAAACQNCSNPCPYNGIFDGANCYLFSWPGVSPFVWSNNWYYKPVWNPGGKCPHKAYNNWTNQWVQPTFDGANCYLGSAAAGQTAFVWGNNYYQSPVCHP